ncbi:RNA 3'-phosphate cyclase [candidate division WOR-3 bacterium JGI_Cruoil_03_44_89]|uniref:RNA 3'-terminal phosphate cyclase n=1 Tax=candidate division WOR-3 bacterium JGI_Cruoil_03_44_89 TaxID=1973748 RepID=A0A235BT31_UNCW3|nr:MAG: RNA 3'-phosphate cyclase [candidate division WOR-3 bacterium JGI_Cruoil_03_44_89]
MKRRDERGNMIEIDGSYLEGGGQIVRTAIALSGITRKPVHIYNIRAGREKPGLRPQHLVGIEAAVRMSNGRAEGVHLGSTDIMFIPGEIRGGEYFIDTRTAGAITLILQTLVPIGIYADSPSQFEIKGGTAVPFSPSIEYFQHILCYFLKMMGISVYTDIKRHGFYPAGGGRIFVKLEPGKIKDINLIQRGELQKIDVLSVASHHLEGARVAERMLDGFKRVLPEANTKFQYVDALSQGCFIGSHAHFEDGKLGADALGKKRKRAEDVGEGAALELKSAVGSNAPIDPWMVDQIIPYLALAAYETGKKVKIRIPELTRHAKTNIWVAKNLLPVDFGVRENLLECWIGE